MSFGEPPALHLVAAAGLMVDDVERRYHVFPMSSPLFGEVATSKEPLLLNGVRDHPRVTLPEWREIARRYEFEALAIYPMLCRDELIGVFYTISGQRIESDEFEAMQLFADQAAIAVKGSRLFEDMRQDHERLGDPDERLPGACYPAARWIPRSGSSTGSRSSRGAVTKTSV